MSNHQKTKRQKIQLSTQSNKRKTPKTKCDKTTKPHNKANQKYNKY